MVPRPEAPPGKRAAGPSARLFLRRQSWLCQRSPELPLEPELPLPPGPELMLPLEPELPPLLAVVLPPMPALAEALPGPPLELLAG